LLSHGSAWSGTADSVGRFARHLNVAAEGKDADFVVGIAEFDSEEAGSKTDGKGLNAHTAKLGDGKMAKLMDYYHNADQDDKRDDCD